MKNISNVKCVGFIMDGNRRWAKENQLDTYEGHKKGYEKFTDSVRWVTKAGIPHATYYAFSTENWNRSEEEVAYLMDLFRKMLEEVEKMSTEEEVRVKIVGRKSDFDDELKHQMEKLEAETAKYSDTTIWIALSYGGRVEILEAVNKAVEKGEKLTEEEFTKLLWTAEMPDPDLIIRTGGENRISNFMTWRSVYSELFFIDTKWPALTEEEFENILNEYGNRERRIGK